MTYYRVVIYFYEFSHNNNKKLQGVFLKKNKGSAKQKR